MFAPIEILESHPLAAAFGAAGLTCQLIWPLFRRRKAILAAQLGIGANYAVQYALLGAFSGAGVAAIGATQTLAALFADEHPVLRRVALAFPLAAILICLTTWNGFASLMAMTACTLIMTGRMQADALRLRIFLLSAAPFGIGHDVLVGAAPALFGAIVSSGVAAVALVREIARRRNLKPLNHHALAPAWVA